MKATKIHRGEFRKMGPEGDVKTIWHNDKPEEVTAIRKMFDELTKGGYTAFRVSPDGERGEIMREFDPDAEAIILAPRMIGG